MSVTKEIDKVAEEIAYYLKQRAYDATTWETSQLDYDEDDYAAIHSDVMKLAIEHLYIDVIIGGRENLAGETN